MVNGQQYFIPWDWGYASILYRTDMVDAADATGWELFWNEKYKGRISMWDGAQSNFEVAALKLGFPEMDNQTSDQVQQVEGSADRPEPLNKFWKSTYSDMQPAFKAGDIWIAYSWQDGYVNMKAEGLAVEFMQPSQGSSAGCAASCSARTRRATTTRTSTSSRSSTTRRAWIWSISSTTGARTRPCSRATSRTRRSRRS